MNEWQRGYDLEMLRELAALFKRDFKPHTYGAFGLPKERDIASALADDELAFIRLVTGEISAVAIFKVLKSGSKHEDFSGTQTASMQKGDLFIKAIAGDAISSLIEKLAKKTEAKAVWLEIHEEAWPVPGIADGLGFRKVLTKISASSDIKGLYHRGDPSGRLPAWLHPSQEPGLKMLDEQIIGDDERAVILDELRSYEATEPWEQHYSSYNKRQSWTAFALKGYDQADPGFIIKPSEMSKQWKAENSARLTAECRWTSAAASFGRTLDIIASKIPCEMQRVRLMRLSSKGGELTRHADITDPEAGVLDGEVSRLHIPLVTSPGCEFRSWTTSGKEQRMHLHQGGLFYLDTRKPHAVRNDSESERIHLVMDVFANDWLRGRLNA